MLKLEDKKSIVTQVAGVASRALSAVAIDYRGLKSNEMTEIRVKARQANVHLQVIRNTLADRALEGTEFACLAQALNGPIFLAFSLDDPGAVGRLLCEFLDKFDVLSVKAIAIGGKLLEPERIKDVAKIPTRNQAIAMLMSVMKAPISNLVCVMSAPHMQLLRTFAAIGKKSD